MRYAVTRDTSRVTRDGTRNAERRTRGAKHPNAGSYVAARRRGAPLSLHHGCRLGADEGIEPAPLRTALADALADADPEATALVDAETLAEGTGASASAFWIDLPCLWLRLWSCNPLRAPFCLFRELGFVKIAIYVPHLVPNVAIGWVCDVREVKKIESGYSVDTFAAAILSSVLLTNRAVFIRRI